MSDNDGAARRRPADFTESDLRSSAGRTLHAAPPSPTTSKPLTSASLLADLAEGPSDFDLNPDMAGEVPPDARIRHAAVLVPVVARDTLQMLLTQRTNHLPSHAGQVAFPGGKIEEQDTGPLETALREAEEEIGLNRAFVEPIGYLDNYRTRTGFLVTPVVALVRPGFTLTLDANEVEIAFEVPFAYLMDEANHKQHSRLWQGRERHFYAMPYGDHYIWGATAGMIRNLHAKLSEP